MMTGLCNWMNGREGQIIMGVATLVGGLHMVLSESQPVLGMLNIGGLTVMGKSIGVQQVIGAVLTVGGACWVYDWCCSSEM